MAGTMIITGANSSIGIPTVKHLLTLSPSTTLILTVRNTKDTDANTKILRETIKQFPKSSVSIRELDLASLKAVKDFAASIIAEIWDLKLPRVSGIVCDAYHWNLVDRPEQSEDGYEKTFQVNHISHSALLLRLLGCFGSKGGRLVLFTSDAHYPGRNGLERYAPCIPDDLDSLVRADGDCKTNTDKQGRGFLNYATSKLAILMWTYALNRRLEEDKSLNNISAIVIDPGNMADSRALRTNTPATLSYMQTFILKPFLPALRLLMPDLRLSADAGVDVAELVLNRMHPGARGYFRLMVSGPSSEESLDRMKQEKIWAKTAEWAGITADDTVVGGDICLMDCK